jgi:hypothetical protein
MTHTTPRHSIPDAGKLLMEGIYLRTQGARRQTADEASTGLQFRGGSMGVILQPGAMGADYAGRSAGKCIRESAARMLGAEPPRDADEWNHRQLMFDEGYANEELWIEPLRAVWPGKILREEEFPIAWQVDGVPGRGREDFILCDTAGKPILLLEMKNVSSFGTLKTVLLLQQPKMEHAIQVANYMLRTGLPGQIYYRNGNEFVVPTWGFLQALLPKSPTDANHLATPYCQWSEGKPSQPRKDGKGWTKPLAPSVSKILPFLVGYNLRWNRGVLEWRPTTAPTTAKWNPSPIVATGLDEFCRAEIKMLEEEVLPPPPAMIEIDGSGPFFDKCSYCSWQTVCRTGPEFANEKPATYSEWRAAVESLKSEALDIEPPGALDIEPTQPADAQTDMSGK